MRCYSCDKLLSDQEACTKFESGQYTEMCNSCLNVTKIAYPDLKVVKSKQDPIEDEEDYSDEDALDWGFQQEYDFDDPSEEDSR